MAWDLLPVDYTDAAWVGLKRYNQIDNEDGTISLQDVTVYSNKEKSFFGAKDANRMNEALNTLMSMVENGTDLYTEFQNYFADQKDLFEAAANVSQEDFNAYIESLKTDADTTIEGIKTDYAEDMQDFQNQQEELFQLWFDYVKGQLGQDVAGNLLNEIESLKTENVAQRNEINEVQLSINEVRETADAAKAITDTRGQAGGLATLDANGKLKEMPNASDVKASPILFANSHGETILTDSDNGCITGMMLYGKSEQDGEPTPENPAEIKSVINPVVVMCGKNLFNPTLKTTTKNGVTCTANGDGTYTLNGTSEIDQVFTLASFHLEIGKYRLVGCPTGNSGSYLQFRVASDLTNVGTEKGNGLTFSISEARDYVVRILIPVNATCNHVVFKPMIVNADIYPDVTYNDFEPYKGQTVSLPYTLNAIPVTEGGNVTIDGQQYISDYVDVDKGVVHSKISDIVLDGRSEQAITSISVKQNVVKFWVYLGSKNTMACNEGIICDKLPYNDDSNSDNIGIKGDVSSGYPNSIIVKLPVAVGSAAEQIKSYLSANPLQIKVALETETEIAIDAETVTKLQSLETYCPTTNVFITSDQLNGYATFNYPVAVDGGNYVVELAKRVNGDLSEIQGRIGIPNGLATLDENGKVSAEQASAEVSYINISRTLSLDDAGKMLCVNSELTEVTSDSNTGEQTVVSVTPIDIVITVPSNDTVDFPVGAELEVCQLGSGTVTFAAAEGVTLLSAGGAVMIAEQYGCATLKKLAANKWLLAGMLG